MRGKEKSREIEFTYETLKANPVSFFLSTIFQYMAKYLRKFFSTKEKDTQTKIRTQSTQIGGL